MKAFSKRVIQIVTSLKSGGWGGLGLIQNQSSFYVFFYIRNFLYQFTSKGEGYGRKQTSRGRREDVTNANNDEQGGGVKIG